MLKLTKWQARADDRSKMSQTSFKNKKIIFLEFGNYIWNHREKCIQISTNMPGIDFVIREIDFESLNILRNRTLFFHCKTNAHVLSVNNTGTHVIKHDTLVDYYALLFTTIIKG